MSYQSVLDFWFKELSAKQWFAKDDDLDKAISERFSVLHHQASVGELSHWRNTPKSALAEIIVLDQFSRNMFRGTPKSFAFDSLALVLAQEAIRRGDYKEYEPEEFNFMMMPFMHSESALVHEEASTYFQLSNNENMKEYEQKHLDIINLFGRYPHRNEILGRESSQEELDFLVDNPGF
ncbi:membrane protein [Marinomonas sp. SBI22]|uniref:DUF924 family protein n=1 Tax=unclassified Marinomonas TaxID=196814 RepID=UPI0007AEFC12|nr:MULTISPECIES: DUF924 family protein [unclassified Marinomonas]KZM42611.1 membrane protein [Marinomonas sp. SBI22]KZM44005.1 membrane protein [Marinomonas sp. SBI8L]